MRPIIRLAAAAAVSVFAGCVSVSQYYTPNPQAEGLEFVDYEGEVAVETFVPGEADKITDALMAKDYYPIGSASFVGRGDVDWCGAFERLAKDLKAEKVCYSAGYVATEHSVSYMNMPTINHSTATVYGHHGRHTVHMTTMSDNYVPYTYDVQINEYQAIYFKKMRHPSAFGMYYEFPDEKLSRELGTRRVVVISRVVPRKIAWRNDLFVGDVISEVDGENVDEENVRALCANPIGRKVKILRGDRELTITIK